MRSFINLLRNTRSRPKEAGQGIVEFVLILMLVGLAVIAIITVMGPTISNTFADFVERAPVAPPALVGFTRVPPTPTATAPANPVLTILPSSGGTIDPDPDPPYVGNQTVVVNAIPNVGYTFAGWGDDLTGMPNPANVLMNRDKVASATFVQQTFLLNVTVTGNGSVTLNPPGGQYPPNTPVTLEAQPGTGSSFISWSGDASGTTSPIVIVMDGHKNVGAYFQVGCYSLSQTVTPGGGGTITANPAPPSAGCTGSQYAHGTNVTIAANPATGYNFNQWSGGASGTNATTVVSMITNLAVTAEFQQAQYTLTTNVNPANSGTVTISPSQPTYLYGDVVALTASPNIGQIFTSWSGDLTGTSNPANLTMNGNKVVTANFQAACYPLTTGLTPVGSGTVNVSPTSAGGCATGSYTYGTIVTLVAAPSNSYTFGQWSGSISGTNSTAQVTMDSAKNITANFLSCYALTTGVTPANTGTVSVSPAANCTGGSTYLPATDITLTAAPIPNYAFTQWTVGASGTTNPLTLPINSNLSITAEFTSLLAQILFVVGDPTALNTSDQAIITRLNANYLVTTVDDNTTQSSDANGKQLVIISSTCAPAQVTTKFRDVTVPVLLWEHTLYDDMNMVPANNNTTTSNQTQLAITDPTHPMGDGLPLGLASVYSASGAVAWGTPNATTVRRIAIQADDTGSHSLIFGYDTGTDMVGLTAPARRVGFFLQDTTAVNLTTTGWNLFDAAVDWAINGGSGNPFLTLNSIAAEDGHIRENGSTNTGGTVTSGNTRITIGDDNNNPRRQFKGVISFDTSTIPAGATIVSVELRLKRSTINGAPYGLGTVQVDMAPTTGFNNNFAIEATDFQASTGVTVNVATLSNTTANGDWATAVLPAAYFNQLSLSGHTQFRLYFTSPDDNDGTNDQLLLYEGDHATGAYRPQLVIVYIP